MKRRNFLKALPAAALALAGCGQTETAPANTASLVFDHSYPLDYAAQFSADCYEGGYVLVNIPDSGRFLVIPEDAAEVDDLPADVVPLRQPLDNIYLVSTSAMDLFVHLDALDCIALSGTKAEGWYVEEAKQAMQEGRIAYAGKYSAPDYERILAAGCSLAIENTMILHDPAVKEQLEKFGVPVRAFSTALVLLSSLLSACVTAFAGPISFVGIAVPHLVKSLLGSAKPLYVLPGCCLGGAAFCLLCDLIARSLFAPTELSISSVTAVFGAPVVIWLLVRRQTQEGRE